MGIHLFSCRCDRKWETQRGKRSKGFTNSFLIEFMAWHGNFVNCSKIFDKKRKRKILAGQHPEKLGDPSYSAVDKYGISRRRRRRRGSGQSSQRQWQMGHPKRETNSGNGPCLPLACSLSLALPTIVGRAQLFDTHTHRESERERENSHCNKKILISFLVFV